MQPVAAGTRFGFSGLMKGLARLGWFRSRLGDDVSFAGLAAGSGVGSGLGDLGRGGVGCVAATGSPGSSPTGWCCCLRRHLEVVDLCLDGRGRGLRPGWGKAAVRNQAFDGYDHGKSLDLAGDAASGHFVAKIGQFPEPGQDLVATKVQLAQPVRLPGPPAFP